jgi:hypothetical protein
MTRRTDVLLTFRARITGIAGTSRMIAMVAGQCSLRTTFARRRGGHTLLVAEMIQPVKERQKRRNSNPKANQDGQPDNNRPANNVLHNPHLL